MNSTRPKSKKIELDVKWYNLYLIDGWITYIIKIWHYKKIFVALQNGLELLD